MLIPCGSLLFLGNYMKCSLPKVFYKSGYKYLSRYVITLTTLLSAALRTLWGPVSNIIIACTRKENKFFGSFIDAKNNKSKSTTNFYAKGFWCVQWTVVHSTISPRKRQKRRKWNKTDVSWWIFVWCKEGRWKWFRDLETTTTVWLSSRPARQKTCLGPRTSVEAINAMCTTIIIIIRSVCTWWPWFSPHPFQTKKKSHSTGESLQYYPVTGMKSLTLFHNRFFTLSKPVFSQSTVDV